MNYDPRFTDHRSPSLAPCPVFIGGEWREISGVETTPVYNPSRGEVIAEVPSCAVAEIVNDAVEAAAAAFPAWRDTPPVERARVVLPLPPAGRGELRPPLPDRLARARQDAAEARGSVYRGIENIEYACGIPTLLMGDTLENIARGVDCETHPPAARRLRRHHAVQLPGDGAALDVPARARLRKYVRPEAERESSADRHALIELLEKAGLPKGVLNIVHGGRECVDALLTHPKVQAISFVGSSPVAKYIYETGTRHGKRVQANGGAKNYIVVMPDADVREHRRGARRPRPSAARANAAWPARPH